MSEIDTAFLDRLVGWMQAGGFSRLSYSHGATRIALVLPEGGDAPAGRPLRVVTSAGLGIFAARHPAADHPFVREGGRVAAGDVLAVLSVGPVMTAVEAPVGGILRRVLVREGATVGYDDALFEIEPDGT